MDFIKINLFYLSYRLRLLLIVCGDIKSNPGRGSHTRVRVIDSKICDRHANLDELAVAGSGYDILVCAKSKVSGRRRLSELCIPGFGCPNRGFSTYFPPGALSMTLYVRKRFRSFRQSMLECSYYENWVFRICNRITIFMFMPCFRNPGQDVALYDFLLDSMARV